MNRFDKITLLTVTNLLIKPQCYIISIMYYLTIYKSLFFFNLYNLLNFSNIIILFLKIIYALS